MPSQTYSQNFKGNMLALSGSLLLSFDALFIKLIDSNIFEVSFLRGVFLFVGTSIILLMIKLISKQNLSQFFTFYLIPVGIFYGLASVFFVISLTLAAIGTALVIIATAPLIAAISSVLLLNERINPETWFASIVALCGVAIVAYPTLSIEGSNNFGMLSALATATCMALAFTYSRKTQNNLFFAPAVGGLFSAAILVPLFVHLGEFNFSIEKLPLMFVEGGLLVPVALGLIAISPRYIPAPNVGLFLLIETIFGPLWVWLFLNDSITIYMFMGGALVILSLIGNTIYGGRSTEVKK